MKGFLTLLMLAATATAAWQLPAKARHHYSETGVFYTTEYATVHLPTGVVGFPPGSRLSACFNVHVPDKEVVTDGTHTLAIDPQTLTHDVEYAQELADADELNQDQSQSRLAQIRAAHAASQHDADLLNARDIDGVNASLVAASTVGNYDTRLNQSTVDGAYGSYGSASAPAVFYGGGGSTVNNVTVIDANRTASTAAQRVTGGLAMTKAARNTSAPQRPLYGSNSASANGPNAGGFAH